MEPASREPNLITSPISFYVTGGTLRHDAASYVRRQADEMLFSSLLVGEFCYVLDARQMGKSSLMIRTATRLEAQGVTVVKLDLTAVGLDISAEQWYFGLLEGLGCHLEAELEGFWEAHRQLGALQRWFKAIEEVLLPSTQGRIVIFVDEIDIVRSLPFRTDEFFAGIRECYNRRPADTEMERLTFCLLGVATPSDLIQGVTLTPFNIGTRIELNDFTPRESAVLAQGLSDRNGVLLLERVLYWTEGHPYLTQQLCRAVAEEEAWSVSDVDRLCAALFLSPRAQKQDNNLLFVRTRLLQSGTDVAGLLELYGQVCANQRIADDETNPLVETLRLSGIVRVFSGYLRVRNRIYFLVFNKEWVRTNMPDAEVRRQRAAYRRGVVRTSTISLSVLTVISLLAVVAARNATMARASAIALRHNLYAADIYLAQHALEEDNLPRARSLLEPYRPKPGEDDLRSFEWRYLWRLTRDQSQRTIDFGNTGSWCCGQYSPDGRILALASADLRLYNAETMQELPPLPPFKGKVGSLAFSPDSKILAVREGTNRVSLYDLATRHQIATFPASRPLLPQADIAFSPDGKTLTIAGSDSPVQVWSVTTHKRVNSYDGASFVSYSPDGRLLVARDNEGIVLWDLALRKQKRVRLMEPKVSLLGGAGCAAFSPDSKRLAVGMQYGRTWILSLSTGKVTNAPMGHHEFVMSIAFSPDGKTLASSSTDNTVRLWAPAVGKEPRILRGHQLQVMTLAFSPDGKTLVSNCCDGTVKFWDATSKPQSDSVEGNMAALSSNGKLVATRSYPGNVVTLRDVKTLRERDTARWNSPYTKGEPAAFSADGRFVYLVVDNEQETHKRILVWNIAAQKVASDLPATHVGWTYFWPSPDGTLLATCGKPSGTIRLFDLVSRRELQSLNGDYAAFSADSRGLAISGKDAVYHVYDTRTWKMVAPVLRPATFGFGPLAFSPDGRLLATSTGDGKVILWDTASWTQKTSFQAHSGTPYTIVFSPDGKTLATCGNDPVVKLWNTDTWRLTQVLKSGVCWRIQFTPDGDVLMTCAPGPKIHFWRAAPLGEIDAPEPKGSITK